MTTTTRTLTRLCGACLLTGGAVGGALPFAGGPGVAQATPAPTAAPAVVVHLHAGEALYGRQLALTISVADTGGSPLGHLAISDLLPSGVTYVPGSARLITSAGTTRLSDPRILVAPETIPGSFLVWAALPSPAAGSELSVSFKVMPEGAVVDGFRGLPAGTVWSTVAGAYAGSGPVVPTFDAAANLIAGTAQETSTARVWLKVTPFGVDESSSLVPTEPGTETHVLRVSAAATSAKGVEVKAYLPAGVNFAGCPKPAKGAKAPHCDEPSVAHQTMAVDPAQPDLPAKAVAAPLVAPPAVKAPKKSTKPSSPDKPPARPTKPVGGPAVPPVTTTTSPTTAPPTTAPAAHVAPGTAAASATAGKPAAKPPRTAEFTVLTWDLKDVSAGQQVTEDYAVKAGSPADTANLVSVSGTTTADPGSHPKVVTATSVDTWPKPAKPATRPAHHTATAGPVVLPPKAKSVAKVAAAAVTTKAKTTSPTTVPASGSTDPFGSSGNTSPTTVPSGSTPTSTPSSSLQSGAKTDPAKPLAFTGIDATKELQVAAAVLAIGIAFVVASKRRNRYRPLHLQARG